MMDTASCATVDIRVFSLSVHTSLYPVTLAWAILGIDRVTIHELLLWLTSDMSLRSCLLMLRFLVRERDGYGSVSELKHDLQDDCVSLAVRLPCSVP